MVDGMQPASRPWPRSPLVIAASAIVFPPLGLVLLWLRPGTRILRKILLSVTIVILAFGELFTIYGLRMEVSGAGWKPIFSFYDEETHYTALERSRREARAAPDTARPEPLPPPPPATGAVPPAVTGPSSTIRSVGLSIGFLGPNRDARYDQLPILTRWPEEGLPLLWKQPIGGGYASFAIAEDLAFTIEQRRGQEVVAAYDVATGRETWTDGWDASFREPLGGDGPRATPAYDEGRVYALGAEGELRCLDARTGKRIWRVNILEDNGAQNLTWGMAASPLVVDGKVIVLPGGSGGRSVVAYDKVTGQAVWKALDDQQAYTAPMVATLGGRRQLLVVSAQRALGLAIEDGRLLWAHPWSTYNGINAAQPVVVGENRLFLSASYDRGATVVELTPNGDGFTVTTVWANNRMKNRFSTSVLYDGYLYGLDEGILACIDPRTGELKWKGGRYGYGSLVLADGHLIVLTERGDLALVKAKPDRHEEVASFSAIDGKTWNPLTLAAGRVLVRNATEMAAFDVAPR
jgi:outer membrane protein assembly factor BamB